MERVRCVSTLWGIIYAIIRRSLESNNIHGHARAVRVVYPIKQGRALLKVLGLGLKVIGEDEFALSSFGKVIAGGVRKEGKGSDRGGGGGVGGATLFACHLLAGLIKRQHCLARIAPPGTADNPSKCAKTNKVQVGEEGEGQKSRGSSSENGGQGSGSEEGRCT